MTNVSESNDINRLIRFVLDYGASTADERQSHDARSAAIRLSARASKTLGKGLHGQDIHDQWPDLDGDTQ